MPARSVRVSMLCLMAVLATVASSGVAHADDGRRGGKGQGASRSAEQAAPRAAAQARRAEGGARGQQGSRQRQRDALADSVREASRRGQVLSAESVPYDGRNINRVKVIDERGRVRVYMDDPQAGRPLRRTRGDDD